MITRSVSHLTWKVHVHGNILWWQGGKQVKMYTTLHFKSAHDSEVSLVSNPWGRSRSARHILLAQVWLWEVVQYSLVIEAALADFTWHSGRSNIPDIERTSPLAIFWTVHYIHSLRKGKGWITWAKHTWHAVYFLFPIPLPSIIYVVINIQFDVSIWRI